MDRERPHILIVDDNPKILGLIYDTLKAGLDDAYEFSFAYNGMQAIEQAQELQPDLIILDNVMPDMNGCQVARHLREHGNITPILMLTASTGEENELEGLNCGCDDYMNKPIRPLLLCSHVQAQLRRKHYQAFQQHKLCVADLEMDIQRHTVYRGGQKIELTTKEFSLLQCFLNHPEQSLTRDFICNQVWGLYAEIDSNVVDVYIGYLRKKLEANNLPRLIQTIHGTGYMLRVPT